MKVWTLMIQRNSLIPQVLNVPNRISIGSITHFLFLTFLARGLRGLANLKVHFSFVNVSDSLGPSSEHNCEVCQTIKNEINETVKELKCEMKFEIGSMDFDNPNVYGDTSIFDGLVFLHQ